jgi:hypothetical protein
LADFISRLKGQFLTGEVNYSSWGKGVHFPWFTETLQKFQNNALHNGRNISTE